MLRKVLIAEDNEINRKLLHNILRNEYDVLEAANGAEAMDILNRKYKMISAVVLDIIMPEMDGYEVLRAMRGNVALAQIPVIVATGSEQSDAEVKALSLGANDFVSKPYNPALILHCLRNNINLRETASIVNAIQRDKLTGLYNRETFFDKASAMIKEQPAGYYIMACFDINNFKLINDQFGAAEGDRILQHIGATVREDMTLAGGLGSRISADNFAAIYPASKENVNFISRIQEKKLTPPALRAATAFSVGRYLVSDLTLPVSAVYDRAYIAKQSVKGRYDANVAYFDETMLEKLVREQEIVSEMDAALAKRQFEVWFQPQFNHSSGALIGAEALARWRHPQKGLIPPNQFIPVFEQNGFVYELDKYVWEESCRCLRRWIDAGLAPLPVSVNISRYDVFREDLVEVITSLVKKYALPTDLLRLEITESAFAKSTDQLIDVVERLMARGFMMEIDDFGSGYSSLNALKDVPANVLKLDMRFLESSGNTQRGGNILESIVRMAKWLDMTVIAEGVEDMEQADFLKSIGCIYIQGYLYAKPMPVAEYEGLIAGAGKEERLLKLETVENLDNNAFWDPMSIDTLIFNSYIGGACIFEYHGGKIELLRANDKYAQVIGSADMSIEDALKLNWTERIDAASAARLAKALEKSMTTGEEVADEFVFSGIPGCPNETYLRSTLRVIAASGEHYLIYCTNENITAQRQAEKRLKKANEQLNAIMNDAGGGITATTLENGRVHFLIANDKYFEVLGYTRERYEAEVEDEYALICPEDREMVKRISGEAYLEDKSATLEYRVLRKDGGERWIRAILSATRFTGVDKPVQLGVFTDITSEKLAELELRETDEQIRFLNEAAHDLLAQPDCDRGIEGTLRKLLEYFDSGRAYVFEFDYENRASDNTYEVCAEGVSPEKANLQRVPMEIMAYWLHAFDSKRHIDIRDVDALDESRADEKRALKAQGIKSLVAVPLNRDGRLIGFLGIDDPQRRLIDVSRLEAIGDYIAVMLTRRDLNEKIESDNRALVTMMNDMPGGFVRMRARADGAVVPIYMNDGFCKLVGMTHDECMALYADDAMAGVHPDDVGIVRDAVERMLSDGQAYSSGYRLLNGSGGYIWLTIFGRATRDAAGNTYMNIYYTGASERDKLEEERKELLDNMPCGAALYELDGDNITAVHINKRYSELVGREFHDVSKLSVADPIHPDDREPMMAEVRLAIREKRDAECDIRVMYGGGGYRSFHVVSRIVPRADGKYAAYTTYSQNADERLSYQTMLPAALSAVMSSSSDLSYVKDGEFRYICCSRAFARFAGLKDEKDVVGKTDYDLVSREHADRFLAVDAEIVATKEPRLDYEEALPSEDGAVRYASTSKYPLLDSSGNVIGIYGVTRDITEYHTAFERLRLVADSIPGGIATYVCSPRELRITYFNDGFCRLFGLTREEYEKKSAEKPISWVFDEDIPTLRAQIESIVRDGTPIEGIYRVHTKGGGFRWINHKAAVAERSGDTVIVNALLLDVTESQEATERLRVSEEEHRLAMRHSGNIICRYTVSNKTISMSPEAAAELSIPAKLKNVPDEPLRLGLISPDSAPAYVGIFSDIAAGAASGKAVFEQLTARGWRWLEASFSTIFSADGAPVSAVISFLDVSERLEKETVYKKWQQSLSEKDPESYTLFRCNLSKNASFDTVEGSLLKVSFAKDATTFNERTREYVEQCVCEQDRELYESFMNSDTMLASYYRGKRSDTLEYRERLHGGGVRWLRLSVDLVEYPSSTDVEAYLMYEDIDELKRSELQAREMAESDPLTGVLNRGAFAERMDGILHQRKNDALCALLMMDLDGFKLVNDSFGHEVGDQALIDMAKTLRSIVRQGDLVGRLGGDEFFVCLRDVPSRADIAKKARQICGALRKSFSIEVQLSTSLGIALVPNDGDSFEELYHKADIALYHVKATGKDNYVFYGAEMAGEKPRPETAVDENALAPARSGEPKRRMLIVEDNRLNRELLVNLFKDDFIIDTADDGNAALIRLRRYGSAISVVLLDLIMPGMDGFAVLEKMRESAEMQTIPVIVVSGMDERETILRTIKCGASDFVTKPVDADLLRLRVHSAISKAENERLRAQNSYLALQSNEVARYRAVLENDGTVMVEYDRVGGEFIYDRAISHYVAGSFEGRELWRALAEDRVASPEDIARLRALADCVAGDAERLSGKAAATLRTPSDDWHKFLVKVIKRVDGVQPGDKLIITFTDVDGE